MSAVTGAEGAVHTGATHAAAAHPVLTHAAALAAAKHAAIMHANAVAAANAQPQPSFSQQIQTWALNWEPVIAIVFFMALIFLMWRTLKVMPKVKPQRIKPASNQSVTFADIAGVDEAKAELAEIVEFLRDPKAFE